MGGGRERSRKVFAETGGKAERVGYTGDGMRGWRRTTGGEEEKETVVVSRRRGKMNERRVWVPG